MRTYKSRTAREYRWQKVVEDRHRKTYELEHGSDMVTRIETDLERGDVSHAKIELRQPNGDCLFLEYDPKKDSFLNKVGLAHAALLPTKKYLGRNSGLPLKLNGCAIAILNKLEETLEIDLDGPEKRSA